MRGQDPLLRHIDRSLKGGMYAHASLLVGPPHVGKGTLAINIAQAVNCLLPEDAPCGQCIQCRHIASGQHADVLVIGLQRSGEDGPPRREIGIDTVRDVQRQVSLKPYEGSHRVFIFDGAEHMSEEAANALLKTLEEPPPQVLMVLLASQEEALLPTIRSRCRRMELRPMPLTDVAKDLAANYSVTEEEAEKLARLSAGCLGWAISAVSDPSIMEKRQEGLDRITQLSKASLEDRFSYANDLASLFSRSREEAKEALYLWLRWWRDLLLIKEGAGEFIYNIDRTDALNSIALILTTDQVLGFLKAVLRTLEALDQNANSRLALEVLMLNLPRERARG